jgi:hypothetical protein
MNDHERAARAVGDARKRLMAQAGHDEQHAHEDIDWRADNITVGED